MKKIFFLLLMLPIALFSQECPFGDKYFPKCDDKGNWAPCMTGTDYKYVPGYDGKSRTCVCSKLGDKYPDVVLLKKQMKNLQKSDASQNVKISSLQKKDIVHDDEITNIKSDVSSIKGRLGIAEDEIKKRPLDLNPKGPTIIEEPAKLAEKSTPKKEEPNLGPGRDAPMVEVPTEPSFFVEPEIGVFWKSNNSPEFTSKSLWLSNVGLRLRYQPQNWQGVFVFAKPSWTMIFGKVYLSESTPSPYPIQAVSQNGFLAEAGVGYRFWEYAEISIGYAQALSKGVEHESGAYADLEFGLEKVPVKLKIGAKYKHDLSFFGGIVARLPIKFKPKA